MTIAINRHFATFQANRKTLNDAYFVVNEVYRKLIDSWTKANPNASGKQFDEYIESIKEVHPLAATAESDELKYALQLWDSEKSSSADDNYKVQMKWNNNGTATYYYAVNNEGNLTSKAITLPKTASSHAVHLVLKALSVGVTIVQIHNMDSNPIVDLMKSKFKGYGVHDAWIYNMFEVVEGTRLMNKSLYDNLKKHDVFNAAKNNLERVVEFLEDKSNGENPIYQNILDAINREVQTRRFDDRESIFRRQEFWDYNGETREYSAKFNTLEEYLTWFKKEAIRLETQKQKEIFNNIYESGFKQYGGIDATEATILEQELAVFNEIELARIFAEKTTYVPAVEPEVPYEDSVEAITDRKFTYKSVTIDTEFTLGEEQGKALKNMIDFVEGRDIERTLIGSAGTGKTSIIGYLQKYITEKNKTEGKYANFIYAAPTHAATAQLAFSTVKTGNTQLPFTVASSVYEGLDKQTNKTSGMFGLKFKEALSKQGVNIFVIDESSMLSEKDIKLLREAMNTLMFPIKVIYMGDDKQISAVIRQGRDEESLKQKVISPALNLPANQTDRLTKVFRQGNNKLLGTLMKIRDSSTFNLFKPKENDINIEFTTKQEEDLFYEKLVESYKIDPQNTLALAYVNGTPNKPGTVAYINARVREALGKTKDNNFTKIGEIINGYIGYANKSVEKQNIANSIQYVITSIDDVAGHEDIGKYIKAESSQLDNLSKAGIFVYKDAGTIYFQLSDSDSLNIENEHLKYEANNKFLSNVFEKINEYNKELAKNWRLKYTSELAKITEILAAWSVGDKYIYNPFTKRMEKYDYKQHGDTKKFPLNLIFDKGIEYGYAITIHKSQGLTKDYVFFHADKLSPSDLPIVNNEGQVTTENQSLAYVAMSRAAKKLTVYPGNTKFEVFDNELNQANTNTKSEVKPNENNKIYSQLGNKTKSTNVVITSWSNLKGVTKAITPNGIVATRIYDSNEHFGNPFSHDPAGKTQGLIKTETVQEAVERYINWVINSNDIRANWIRIQLRSEVLKGKPILYYKELGEPSHATALDYLINKYDWHTKPSEDTNLGSQGSTITNLFEPINSLGNIDSTNILDTANRLENVGNVRDEDTHTTHLKSILGGFISKVLQPLQYFEMTSPEANIGEYDPSGKIGLNISNAPIAPTIKVPMSALTTFVHELVHGVTASALFDPKNSILRNRVQKIFNHIEREFKKLDKETGTNYIDTYSHIFANKNKTILDNGTEVNHGLAELIAFAETEPMFRELLNSLPKMTVGKITETWDESKDKFVEANLLEIVSNVFNKILVWWNDKIKGDHSTDVLPQLHTLTVQLSTAHLKAKSTILDFKLLTDKSDSMVMNKIHSLLVNPLLKLLGNNYFTLNPSKNIASIANNTRGILDANLPTKKKVDILFETVDEVKRALDVSEEHWLTYSLNEITGQIAVGNFTQALNMTKKLRDKVVSTIQNTISSNLRSGFKTNLTKQLERVIYNTLLKTDLSSLQDYYKDDLLNMFDGSKRKVEQEKLKKEILKNSNGKLYLGHAYNTAFFMVKNQATKSFQHSTLTNATQIYNLQGSNFKPVGDRDSTVELIDKLIGLYTLDLVNQEELSTLKELFNTDSHGLNITMEVHRQQKEHHLNDILKGNKSLVVKGSTKELTNPNRQIIIATAAEEEKLKLNHYTKGNKIVYESKELYVYHSKFRLMQPWVQGIISYTHMNNILSDMKGVMKQSDGLDQIIQDEKLDKSAKAKMLQENNHNANKTVFDTTEANYTLNPVFNGKGYVSKHSFMLSNQDKENLLDMNTNFTHILGAMVANITDKLNTQRLNDESVKMLIKNRMDNLETKGIQWVTLSKDAKTKNERDIWNKLTPEFKETIFKEPGSNEIVVNAKLLKMIFGQRKLSLSDFFRPADEQELSTFVKYFGSQLYPYIKKVNLDRTTQVWQEGIGYLKDQLVVKSGTVLMGNEISNFWVGYMEGMTVKQYVKAKTEALRLVIGYHKLQTQINDIEYLLAYDKEISSTMRTNLETKLSNLTSERNLSLIKKYEDAGQMKTIVEDGLEDENIWSFRNEFFESRIKSVTDKLPKPIKAIGREVFMTHDTKMYQLMKDLTQMSDLTSRIAVGEFKQSHGMTEKEALQLVDEAFINYDIPSHQNIQFAADMGLFMFNKFFFRIQSVIAREVGQHPARFLTLLGIEQVFGAQEAIHHSLMTPDTIAGHFSAPWKLPFAIWDENFYNNLLSFHAPVYQPV
jgi:hypothetical protein